MYDSNSLDKEKALASQALWDENLKQYRKEFEKNSNKLTKRLLKIITSPYLHDALIINVHVFTQQIRSKSMSNITVRFSHNESEGMITYYDVKNVTMDISKLQDVRYLYGELLFSNDRLWTHGILLTDGEISITCKRLDWIPSK